MPLFDITVDATIFRYVRLFFDEVDARDIDPDWTKEWYCEESYRAEPGEWEITEVGDAVRSEGFRSRIAGPAR